MGLQRCDSPGAPRGVGWRLALYEAAGEAGGSFRHSWQVERGASAGGGDPERARAEAAKRARREVRRYCAANRLNRFGTLTYAGSGQDDPRGVRADVAAFFKRLRAALGGEPLPYVWVPEWHKTDHGLHLHFAVGRYIRRGLIEDCWGHGHIKIKLIGDLPVGSGAWEEARVAGRYLAKYLGKDAEDERRPAGLHRYEVAQGFKPEAVLIWGRTVREVLQRASERMGARPARLWESREEDDWPGPPAVWAAWRG